MIAEYELVVFEGSDWCSSCRKFEKEILKDSAVISFLETNKIELVKVDFPQRKKLPEDEKIKNQELAEKYQFKGVFPSIILVTNDKFIELKSSNNNPEEFIEKLNAEMINLK